MPTYPRPGEATGAFTAQTTGRTALGRNNSTNYYREQRDDITQFNKKADLAYLFGLGGFVPLVAGAKSLQHRFEYDTSGRNDPHANGDLYAANAYRNLGNQYTNTLMRDQRNAERAFAQANRFNSGHSSGYVPGFSGPRQDPRMNELSAAGTAFLRHPSPAAADRLVDTAARIGFDTRLSINGTTLVDPDYPANAVQVNRVITPMDYLKASFALTERRHPGAGRLLEDSVQTPLVQGNAERAHENMGNTVILTAELLAHPREAVEKLIDAQTVFKPEGRDQGMVALTPVQRLTAAYDIMTDMTQRMPINSTRDIRVLQAASLSALGPQVIANRTKLYESLTPEERATIDAREERYMAVVKERFPNFASEIDAGLAESNRLREARSAGAAPKETAPAPTTETIPAAKETASPAPAPKETAPPAPTPKVSTSTATTAVDGEMIAAGDIRKAQEVLEKLGFNTQGAKHARDVAEAKAHGVAEKDVPLDGMNGYRTAAALKQVKQALGLPVTGGENKEPLTPAVFTALQDPAKVALLREKLVPKLAGDSKEDTLAPEGGKEDPAPSKAVAAPSPAGGSGNDTLGKPSELFTSKVAGLGFGAASQPLALDTDKPSQTRLASADVAAGFDPFALSPLPTPAAARPVRTNGIQQ